MTQTPLHLHRRSWFQLVILAILLVSPAPAALAVRIGKVPDPRPQRWVVDLTHTLDPATVRELNEISERISSQGGELVVVMVNDLSSARPRRFATALGNRWAMNPRGALILVAQRDRASEIILGNAVDGASQIRTSQRIMDRYMVPFFRKGRYGAGLLAGAQATEREILTPPSGATPTAAPQQHPQDRAVPTQRCAQAETQTVLHLSPTLPLLPFCHDESCPIGAERSFLQQRRLGGGRRRLQELQIPFRLATLHTPPNHRLQLIRRR